MALLESIAAWVAFIVPAYVANAAPVVFGGGRPLDFGRKFLDGRRVFGDGKTIAGFASGIVFGTIAGALEGAVLGNALFWLQLGFVLSLGAMLGDLAGSFAKRRLGIQRGRQFFLADQLSFLIAAVLFAYPLYPLDLYGFIFLVALTLMLHILSNFMANRIRLKRVPW
jgi:CDP-2,3-bis-(O-geranylgeranyl)-sn-glycerol synthase